MKKVRLKIDESYLRQWTKYLIISSLIDVFMLLSHPTDKIFIFSLVYNLIYTISLQGISKCALPLQMSCENVILTFVCLNLMKLTFYFHKFISNSFCLTNSSFLLVSYKLFSIYFIINCLVNIFHGQFQFNYFIHTFIYFCKFPFYSFRIMHGIKLFVSFFILSHGHFYFTGFSF